LLNFVEILLSIMIQVLDLKFKEYISAEQIQARVREIAEELNTKYSGKNPLFLGILNGSFMFIADIFKNVNIPCEVSFLKINSYQDTSSTEKIKELIGLNQSIEGRHVIILEDIVDTGRTLDYILRTVQAQKPASVEVATLLYKPSATIIPVPIHYVGFEIENQFVLGYGLDYNGYGRNSNSILIKVDE
jgi:hypoxanthine phosphoribosyltransferase